MATANQQVSKLYRSVVDDVINHVRESFIDEGVDEQVLLELKQLWDNKLQASKALDHVQSEQQLLALYAQQHPARPAQPVAPSQSSQLLAFNTSQSTLSAAAQTAKLALPPNLIQQQLAALSQAHSFQTGISDSGQQYFVQTSALQGANQQHGITVAVPAGYTLGGIPQILVPQQPKTVLSQNLPRNLGQFDGANDSSSSEDNDPDDDDEDDEDDDPAEADEAQDADEENPLNSEDDVSEDDPGEVFDTENVVVCQFDKINRSKNKWKFHLKDGIMNLNGKDFVFQRCAGDAEW